MQKNKHKENYTKKIMRMYSILLTMALLVTSINWPGAIVYAAEDITLSLKETVKDVKQIDVQYSVPSGYGTVYSLLEAGYTKVQVEYEVTGFTADGDPGLMVYASTGDKYEYKQMKWINLSPGMSDTVECNLQDYPYSDTLHYFGVMLLNMKADTVTYKIKSVKLLYTGETPSKDPINPGGGGGSTGETVRKLTA